MSLYYIVTSPLLISGSGSSELKLNSGGSFINIITPLGLSNTYNLVLPPDIGVQRQVLGLKPSLETDWINRTSVINNTVSDDIDFFSTNTSYILIPSMTLIPPAGTYYCIFSTYLLNNGDISCFITVGGSTVIESLRVTDGENSPLSTIVIITVNGSQTVEVQASGTNFQVGERVLILNRLS